MSRRLLTGNGSAAWGARLARVDYIPAFPITPQTEIIETIAEWIDKGKMTGRMVTMESEHAMITAAGAASATGVRVFSATSSQGLLYAMEMIYSVAGWRTPLVLVNVSRGISAPITLEPDHNDVLAARDSGFLQIHCSTCQEVLDTTLMAYRLAEDERVRLPVIVNQDGFYLSFTREPVEIPDSRPAAEFAGDYNPENMGFRASSPSSQAVAVLGAGAYSYFRYETHLAAREALSVYGEIAREYRERFGRYHPIVETYRTEDAEYAFVMMDSFATKAKDGVDRLRESGVKIGLVRPRLLRPFPEEQLCRALAGMKGAAVIDQNLSMGKGGVLYTEIASALYGQNEAAPLLASFIGGLGGRDISAEEFYEIAATLEKAVEQNRQPRPRLLYTAEELRAMRKLQAIAHVERHDPKPGG